MKNNFDIVVQKFGGSSLATPEKVKEVAGFITRRLKSAERICVVVSAMGHTTNELIKLAYAINENPSKRELDMLISCGERSSMALMAMALHEQGVTAVSLTGSQSGIITDENHAGAEIIAIRPERVHQAFLEHQVVLIAGFQGMSQKKEITTLKRGGSDTTAVAMAAALSAHVCEIYTDVCGVMDIDPSISPAAKLMTEMTPDALSAMSLYGAKVMAYDAARLAQSLGIEILIAKTGVVDQGTRIREVRIRDSLDRRVCAITHLRAVVRCIIPFEQCHHFDASYFLCGHVKDGSLIAYGSNDIAQEFSLSGGALLGGLGLITVHLSEQSMMPSIFGAVTQLLLEKAIPLTDAILGFKQLSLVIADEAMNEALPALFNGLKTLGVKDE